MTRRLRQPPSHQPQVSHAVNSVQKRSSRSRCTSDNPLQMCELWCATRGSPGLVRPVNGRGKLGLGNGNCGYGSAPRPPGSATACSADRAAAPPSIRQAKVARRLGVTVDYVNEWPQRFDCEPGHCRAQRPALPRVGALHSGENRRGGRWVSEAGPARGAHASGQGGRRGVQRRADLARRSASSRTAPRRASSRRSRIARASSGT